jgi:prevent-host-death family protein
MVTITAAELQKQFGRYRDMAIKEPLSVTHHGRESLVILSAEEYKRLKSFDNRQSLYAWELPDDVVNALDRVEIPVEAEQFNHEAKA